MKHFTAELYEQFNSRDVDVADAADTQWDQAQGRYKARLGEIRQSLPAAVRFLANKLCLHDAELVHLAVADKEAFIQVRQQNALHMLSYRLMESPSIGSPRSSSAFSDDAVRWLYDEVDLRKPGIFSHDILLSNGQELGLAFDDVRIESFEVHPMGTSQKLAMTDRILNEGQELAKRILAPGGGKRSSSLVAKAKELRTTIRDLKKRRRERRPDLRANGTKSRKVGKLAIGRDLRSSRE